MAVIWIGAGRFAPPPPVSDDDAQAYITAVETADGQVLETDVRDAINAFVVDCKADGIWNAIKASCIMAGARTLNGCLVPLVGTAPTNIGFVSGDYNRKTGLVGNGSSKYLNTNRSNAADPQNSNHNAIYRYSGVNTFTQVLMGTDGGNTTGSNVMLIISPGIYYRNRSSGAASTSVNPLGLVGYSRSTASSYTARVNQSSTVINQTSQPPRNVNIGVFAAFNATDHSSSRISFYSIGESLDLALLDARVTTLMNALAVAIP